MTDCNTKPIRFSRLKSKKIVADFDGGHLTSDAGGLLPREADRQLGLTRKLAARIPDPRNPLLTVHDQHTMLDHLRRTALADTDLRSAQVTAIRLKLFKVAARVITSVRRIIFHLSSSRPYQPVFRRAAAHLVST